MSKKVVVYYDTEWKEFGTFSPTGSWEIISNLEKFMVTVTVKLGMQVVVQRLKRSTK